MRSALRVVRGAYRVGRIAYRVSLRKREPIQYVIKHIKKLKKLRVKVGKLTIIS